SIVLDAYEGPGINAFVSLDALFAHDSEDLAGLGRRLAEGFAGVAGGGAPGARPELALRAMVQRDWLRHDAVDGSPASYAAAAASQVEKARRLLDGLQASEDPGFLAEEAGRLEQIAADIEANQKPEDWRGLYIRLRWLKRAIALENPLMQFGPMLCCKRVPTSYSHLVMQYYGWRARPGGGLFVVASPGHSLVARDILAGQLPSGNILEPRLSCDATRIVFSFVACSGAPYDPNQLDNVADEAHYHIYECNVDGSGLRQLTAGPFDDMMPAYLPDGGIAFCSTRRRGYARCFGAQFSPRWDTYTLHRMDADGGNLHTLSYNDVSEWFPAVSNAGHVLYSRWDYIDRDAVTHQNLWATRPDGTNPIAVWGNATPSPHCTFQIQPIPNSTKIVFTASAHHSIAGGSIVVADPSVHNNSEAAIRRITPEVPFPEAEGRDIREYYAAPWPLSEEYFLVAYCPTPLIWEPGANARNGLGIYLLDTAGNRELLYRDPDIGCTNPCPLVPRPTPPVLASSLPADPPDTGELFLMNIYDGLGDAAPGSIKRLRIIQIFPKATPVANTPPIGMAGEENGRAVLGSVPVEPDGSASFIVPARKALLFQALDEDGFAYQTMRSLTYLQPGERVSCIGCHENRLKATDTAFALRRPPSPIEAGPYEGEPFSYMRVVQPVLDGHCVGCHGGDEPKAGVDLTAAPHNGFARSYCTLCGDVDFGGTATNPENAAAALVPRFGARNQLQATPPGGRYGARGSRLIAMLRKGHHGVELTADEFRRIGMWIDCNAIFYGANTPERQAKQLRGEAIPMPEIQ
ncbi:MAG: PD40 domain-containing protein, partial [Candidatus Hydrogenedentes bacterium]|nr:PD40 domain-containing protein [Candidatus Hydrogenedentota bacterium]